MPEDSADRQSHPPRRQIQAEREEETRNNAKIITLAFTAVLWWAFLLIAGAIMYWWPVEPLDINLGVLTWMFLALSMYMGFNFSPTDMIAVVSRFGEAIAQRRNGGLVVIPWPIATIDYLPGTEFQVKISPMPYDKDGKPTKEEFQIEQEESEWTVYIYDKDFRFTFASYEIGLETITADFINEKLKSVNKPGVTARELNAEELKDVRERVRRLFPPDAPTNKEMTIDPIVTGRGTITNGVYFFRRVGRGIKPLSRYFQTVASGEFQQMAGRYTVAMARYYQGAFEERVKREVERMVYDKTIDDRPRFAIPTEENGVISEDDFEKRSWGVDIAEFHVESWGLPKRVSEEQAENAKAGYAAQKLATLGIGDRDYDNRQSEAERYRREQLGLGEAAHLDEVMEVIESSPDAMELERLKLNTEVAGKADFIIVPGGAHQGGLLGDIIAGSEYWNRRGGQTDSAKKDDASGPRPTPGQPGKDPRADLDERRRQRDERRKRRSQAQQRDPKQAGQRGQKQGGPRQGDQNASKNPTADASGE